MLWLPPRFRHPMMLCMRATLHPALDSPCCARLLNPTDALSTAIAHPLTLSPPPCRAGTGKTKTILGLLSIIMHSAPRGAFASAVANGSSSSAPTSPTSAAGLPSYVRYQKLSRDKKRRVWMEANPHLLGRPDPRWVGRTMQCGRAVSGVGCKGQCSARDLDSRVIPAAVFHFNGDVGQRPQPACRCTRLQRLTQGDCHCPAPHRDEIVPPELADPSDAFGLLRRCIPRRIGKSEGPKARVLVRLRESWLIEGQACRQQDRSMCAAEACVHVPASPCKCTPCTLQDPKPLHARCASLPPPGVRPLQLCTRRDCAAAHLSRPDRPGRPSVHTQRGKPAVAKAPRGRERLGRQPQQVGCPYFSIRLHICCLPYSLAVFVLSRMAPQSPPSGSHALPTALPPPCRCAWACPSTTACRAWRWTH